MVDPLIPDPAAASIDALEALVAARPGVREIADRGRWGHLLAGWRAQQALVIQRIAEYAQGRFLALAEGDALRELVASERFDTIIPEEPTRAVGELGLVRTQGPMAAGVIRQGHRFVRAPDPAAQPVPIEAAEYETVEPAVVQFGQPRVTLKIRATRAGAHANERAEWLGGGEVLPARIESAAKLFDPDLVTEWAIAGGGSDRPDDATLRRAAKAGVVGRYAPTDAALLARAFRYPGVAYAGVYDDARRGAATLAAADPSWSSSALWRDGLIQALQREAAGFGLRVSIRAVYNQYVSLKLTVRLRSADDTADTTDISEALRLAARAYFDERPDWYTWKLSALRAKLSRAHPRILRCTDLEVYDRTGSPIGEPHADDTAESLVFIHYFLAGNAIDATFLSPGA